MSWPRARTRPRECSGIGASSASQRFGCLTRVSRSTICSNFTSPHFSPRRLVRGLIEGYPPITPALESSGGRVSPSESPTPRAGIDSLVDHASARLDLRVSAACDITGLYRRALRAAGRPLPGRTVAHRACSSGGAANWRVDCRQGSQAESPTRSDGSHGR